MALSGIGVGGVGVGDLANIATSRGGRLLSALANIYGMYQSSKANKEIDEEFEERMGDLTAQFNKASNTPFLQTEHGKSFIKNLGEQYADRAEKVSGAAVVGGATPEAQVAAREGDKKTFDQALSKFAGYGTQYKDMKEREYNRRSDALKNYYLQHLYGKAENWTNFLNNAANLGQTSATTGAMANTPSVSLSDIWGS
ncbi:MAG TPA: hypothetical protein HPP51_05450 [Planctomycetes bacterium]|nr:hypothetical protein [Planctomycetota bacterium]